jgi:glycosyltransferase involved in cell wall biosynthesis
MRENGDLWKDEEIRHHINDNNLKICDEFKYLIKRESVDCVLSCDALWGITQTTGLAKQLNCQQVLSLHVLNTKELLEQAREMPYSFTSVVSTILKQQVEDICPLKNLVVIPNSIDTNFFKPYENIGLNSKIIFCNARIDPGKGILYLLQAFAKFRNRFPEFNLWLCNGNYPFGDKPKMDKLVNDAINELGIKRFVKFLPNLSWTQIPTIIRQSYVVVLPTFFESFGLAALEAMSCGVPVITTSVGNLPNLVGDGGILIPPKSSESIFLSLISLLESPELYNRLSKTGRQIALNYDNSIIADRYIKLIDGNIK